LLSLVLVLPLVKGNYYSHVIVAARVATCIEQQTRLLAYGTWPAGWNQLAPRLLPSPPSVSPLDIDAIFDLGNVKFGQVEMDYLVLEWDVYNV
jgi:hypothetical protein